jgi:hypothetical protein
MDTGDAGPVDVVLLRFEGTEFSGQLGPALRDLVEQDLVTILDLLFVYKNRDGTIGSVALSGLDAELERYFADVAGQLAGGMLDAEDADVVAPGLEPGSSMVVLVIENRWVVPFISAVRATGGELVDQTRIPSEVVAAIRSGGGPTNRRQ